MTINFKKLSEKAVQPVRTANSGAGFNLTVTDITTEINSGMQEMTSGMNQINNAIQEINVKTNDNQASIKHVTDTLNTFKV